MTRVGILLLLLATAVVMVLALAVGSTSVDFSVPFGGQIDLVRIRLPRILLAAMAGAGLAAAGVTFQAILRNPLADPYIVGVSGGAALGGVVAMVLGVDTASLLPAFAFLGAVASALFLFAVAAAHGRTDPLTLLLVGVVFNAFAAAVVTFLKTIVSPTKAQEILFWLMGVIYEPDGATLAVVGLYLLVGAGVLLAASGTLNLLSTSDDEAAAMGLSVGKARLVVFLAAALLVGSVVAACGMIGFVGLVVPHILRLLVGADHRRLLPAAILGGACFLVVADAIARVTFLIHSTVVPVGVVTAFTGGPFFLALLLRRDS